MPAYRCGRWRVRRQGAAALGGVGIVHRAPRERIPLKSCKGTRAELTKYGAVGWHDEDYVPYHKGEHIHREISINIGSSSSIDEHHLVPWCGSSGSGGVRTSDISSMKSQLDIHHAVTSDRTLIKSEKNVPENLFVQYWTHPHGRGATAAAVRVFLLVTGARLELPGPPFRPPAVRCLLIALVRP